MRSAQSRIILIISILLGLVLLVGLGIYWRGLTLLGFLEFNFLLAPWLWVSVIVAGILLLFSFPSRSFLVPGTITALILVGSFTYGLVGHGYLTAKNYANEVQVDEVTQASFHDRAPWVVANNYASRDQGDTVGDRGPVNHVPLEGVGESSRYTTLIAGRDLWGHYGYAAVREFTIPKVGQMSNEVGHSCEVPASMPLRWDSFWPGRSLVREASFIDPFLHFEQEDMYAYCEEGKPVIVIPAWKNQGLWTPKRVAAGALVYRQEGLKHLSPEALLAENIAGPTYPDSLARLQRESLTALGTLGDSFSGRAGYDATDKDTEDANAGNHTEFILVGTDNRLYFVTPLTPRGTSQNITALMVLPAKQGVEGAGLPQIQTNHNLTASSSIETNIRNASVGSSYENNEWVARWSSGMTMYELVPSREGHWVASIGLGQGVNYRASVSPEGRVTVVKVTGDTPPDEGTTPQEPVTVEGGKPLADMTREELVALMEEALRELAKR